MRNWGSLTLAQKCFKGLTKHEILPKQYYDMLKEGRDFRTVNGIVEDIPEEIIVTNDFIIVYWHRDDGVIINCNGAHVAIHYDLFNKGYEYIMSNWES